MREFNSFVPSVVENSKILLELTFVTEAYTNFPSFFEH